MSTLYQWLEATERVRDRFNQWDKDALAQTFNRDIADRAEMAFRAHWRTTPPVLWSARPADEKGSIRYDWIHGLTGVSAEASTPGWTASLSPSEARTAAAYATIEIGGFAPFVTDLAESHLVEVEEVIGGEVSAELSVGGEYLHLSTLQNLTYSEGDLKRIFVPRLLDELRLWPTDFAVDTEPHWARHLDSVLRILSEVTDGADRMAIAQECAERYEANPLGPVALVWLRGLFQFDAVWGAQVLIQEFEGGNDASSGDRAIETFAALVGNERSAIGFEIEDPAQRARLLGSLVRYAYAFVRREDDQIHEGVYTPNTRDHAETARHFLLSMLLDTPGPDAWRVLLELADEDDFAHQADRLRLQARQRAAVDAEFPPFDPADVIALDTRHEAPPRDRDGLFSVMMDRLVDLEHDLSHHDFTIRSTLRDIRKEPEIQPFLARWFLDRANGAYVVTREDQVADGKHPDIRLSFVNGDLKAVVEVKIADNWTLIDLERALRNQLTAQYLRYSSCKAGCLLLTYHGRRRYWYRKQSGTRRRTTFLELVTLLDDKARVIDADSMDDVRIAVFGLDLTDPPLASRHPGSS